MKHIPRTRLVGIALILAAVAVIGTLFWLTSGPATPEDSTITVEVVPTPTPSETEGTISPEAVAFVPVESPEVAGVSTTAPAGPVENMLLVFGLMALVGLGSSLFLAKLA